MACAINAQAGLAQAAEAEAGRGLTPPVLYQFLLGEIAAQRGQLGLAASAYAVLAESTRDVALARRAAEMALHAKQYDLALKSARLWSDLAPDDAAATQLLSNVLVASQRTDELAAILARDLAAAGPGLDVRLLRLNRLFTRLADKIAVQRLIEQVTLPYIERPEAHFVRAQAALNANDPERAKVAIDEALRRRPDWEMAVVFKAQQMERGPQVVEFLQTFVSAHPEALEARKMYARALVGEKRYTESRAEFKTLLAAVPDNPELLNAIGILSMQLDEHKEAERSFLRLLEIGAGDSGSAQFYLAQIAEDDKRYDDALRRYDAIESGEHQSAALLRGAQILYKQGRSDDARQRLQRARRVMPQEAARLWIAESQMLRDAGRDEDSLGALEMALKDEPEQPDLIYEAALASERLNRLAEAERYLRRLIVLQPEQAQGYNALGYSLADRNVRLDEAQTLIDKALSLTPDDPFILDSKGWVLFRRGEHAAALDALQQAYAKRPDAEIAAHIGEVLWAMGKHDEARRVLREAAKTAPANAVLGATLKRLLPAAP